MKKQWIKVLSILFAVMLMTAALFTACKPQVESSENTTEVTEATEPTEPDETDAPTDEPTDAPTEKETYEVPTEHIDTHEIDEDQCADFREFAKALAGEMLAEGGTFDVHFFIKDPVSFGIEMDEIFWASMEVTDHDAQDLIDGMNGIKEGLAEFEYEHLDEDSRITYDMLMDYAETNIREADEPLLYEPLSYSSGVTSYLPTELAIYTFDTKEDVEVYLELLEKLPDYFKSIISYEKTKCARGLLMDKDQLDKTVEQCESFLKSQEGSFLYSTFEERIRKHDFTEDEIQDLIARNREAVDKGIYDSFRYVIDEMKKLQGKQKYSGAMCNYPGGTEYFENMVRNSTGSSKTPDEMFTLLEKTLKTDTRDIKRMLNKNSDLATDMRRMKYPSGTPEELLLMLEDIYPKYFPTIDPVDYKVSYVDPSLRDYLSPAFYFVAPIDLPTENQIFINSDPGREAKDIFITLAHEGYPGHLYQTNYMQQNGVSPIRRLLGTNGFTEGYAEYVEFMSYSFIDGVSKDLVTLQQLDAEATLCLYALLDIGINYKGWSVEDASDYLYNLGYNGGAAAEIYVYTISDPGGYLDYIIGELEIKALKEDALAAGMSQMNFHKRLLDLSGAPFDMIRKYMFEE